MKYDIGAASGNMYIMMGYTARALRNEGLSKLVQQMYTEASKGDYDNCLFTCMGYLKKANRAAKKNGSTENSAGKGRTKKADVIFPKCLDTRVCVFRKDGKCTILTSAYEKDGECPFCKGPKTSAEPAKKKKKRLSPGQIVDSRLNLSATHPREPDCEFYMGTKQSRLECKATCNESCKGCRFYSANKAARTEAIAAYLLQTDKELAQMRRKTEKLEKIAEHIDELRDYIGIGKSVVRYTNKRRELM